MSDAKSTLPPKIEISPVGFRELRDGLLEVSNTKAAEPVLSRLSFSANSPSTEGPLCAVCQKPVSLRASETNESGKALHSECAVQSTDREGPREQYDEPRRRAS
jgi:hypothetical protein